ncbi:hypothetical protein JA1_004053 [Spathaspora sp. JA1]|nr:hypothetical protein JA1_004053 [Spathaspora sp. JA1]
MTLPMAIPLYEKDRSILTRTESIVSEETMLTGKDCQLVVLDVFSLILNLEDVNLILDPKSQKPIGKVGGKTTDNILGNVIIPGDVWLYHDPIKNIDIKQNILSEINQMLKYEYNNQNVQFEEITLNYYQKLLTAYNVYDVSSSDITQEDSMAPIPNEEEEQEQEIEEEDESYSSDQVSVYSTASSTNSMGSLKVFGKKVINSKRFSNLLISDKSDLSSLFSKSKLYSRAKKNRQSSISSTESVQQQLTSQRRLSAQRQPKNGSTTQRPKSTTAPRPKSATVQRPKSSPGQRISTSSLKLSTFDKLKIQRNTFEYYHTLIQLQKNCQNIINQLNNMNQFDVGYNKFKKFIEFIRKFICKFLLVDLMNMVLSYCTNRSQVKLTMSEQKANEALDKAKPDQINARNLNETLYNYEVKLPPSDFYRLRSIFIEQFQAD